MNTARRVTSWLAPDRKRVGVALLMTAVVALLNLPTPILVQGLVDRVVTPGRYTLLPAYLGGLLAVFAVQAGVSFVNTRLVGRIGQGVVRDLRHRLYDRLQRLGLRYYDTTPSGSIIARIMDDVSAIQVLVTAQTVQILTDLGTTLAITAFLMTKNYRLALIVFAFLPVYAINFRFFMKRIRANSVVVRAKMDLIFGLLKEKIDGSLVIKASAQEPAEVAEFAAQLDDAHGPRVRDHRLSAAFSNLSAAISGVGTSAVFAAGAWEVLHDRMTPGGAVSTAALAALLFGPVARLADLTYVLRAGRRERRPAGRDPRPRTRRRRAGRPRRRRPRRRPGDVRPRRLRVRGGAAGRLGHPAGCGPGHARRAGRPDGVRQEHAH